VIWSQRGRLRESNISVATLNQLYMDTSFSGDAQQCDEETCELIRNTMEFKPTIGIDESNTVSSLSLSLSLPFFDAEHTSSLNSTSTSSMSTVMDGQDVSIV